MKTTVERKAKQRTCRLITLCSDNSTFDLKVLSAIIAYAAALIPPNTTLTSIQSHSTSLRDPPSTTTASTITTTNTTKDGIDGDPMSTVIAALNAAFAGSSTMNGSNSNNNNTMAASPTGRSGKMGKGSKKAAAALTAATTAAAAAAASLLPKLPSGSVTSTDTTRSIFAGGLLRQPCDWYSVLQSPQWEVPLVFIHKLPEIEVGEDDTCSVTASSHRGSSSDFCTNLQRALQIITEEIENTTAVHGNPTIITTTTNTDTESIGNKETITPGTVSEISATTIPSPVYTVEEVIPPQHHHIPNEEIKGKETVKDIAVILALQDPRLLALLMNNRKTLVSNHVDIRLIVDFVDSHPNQGILAPQNHTAGNTSGPQRPRVGSGSSKRTNTRENLVMTPSGTSKEAGDRVTSSPNNNINTFELWIDRYQREGQITVITSPSAASHASNILCLREVLDGESEDRKLWIHRCVHEVLPTLQYMARDMAQYNDWFSTQSIHQYPITVSTTTNNNNTLQHEDISMYSDPNFASHTQQRSRTAMFTSIATSVPERDPMRSTIKEVSLPSQIVEQTRPYKEERCSYYLRERKVRGQWTCVSAVRALAAQVTVSLARQQQPKIVQTTLEDKPLQEATIDPLTVSDKHVKDVRNIEDKNASLMQQLRLYSSRQSVLAILDDMCEEEDVNTFSIGGGEMDNNNNTTTTNNTNNKRRSGEQQKISTTSKSNTTGGETGTEVGTVRPSSSLSVPIQENEKINRFDVTATLPLDHTMDRPTSPPHPDEIRWLTRQFVGKGLGLFAVPPAELDSNLMKDLGGTTTISSNSIEHFQAVMRIRELLEDPLNGFTVEEGEDAVDMHLLQLIESDFNRTAKESPLEWGRVCESAVTSFGSPVVKEKLQRSVERSLTSRERRHIVQQVFLQRAAAEAGISDIFTLGMNERTSSKGKNTKKMLLNNNTATITSNTVGDGENDITGAASRSIEEFVTKPVAIQRLYDFQSRFGTHLCRLLHCTVPDPMDTINGTFTASYSLQAENVYPPKRVTSVMLGGVPVPPKREVQRVWCHYVSGVPSLDQFNELVASETAIASHMNSIDMKGKGGSLPPPSSSIATASTTTTTTTVPVFVQPTQTTRRATVTGTGTGNTSTGWGGSIGDLLRRQLLRHLRNSSQLLVPTGEETEKMGNVCSSEGKAQTILEGRHALYPYDDSIVEVVTTDRSRMCRYVKSSEINCVLHYSIPSPSVLSAPSTVPISFAGSFPLGPSTRKRLNEETIYFTTSFDDGVVLTCTQRVVSPSLTVDNNAMTMSSEKDNVSNISTKSVTSRRGKLSSRGGKSQTGTSTGFADENQAGGRRLGRRYNKGKNRDDGGEALAASAAAISMRPDEPPRPFPVAQDGSILLWSLATPNVASDTMSSQPGTTNVPSSAGISRGIPKLAVTIAANGFTIHTEEYEAVLWITHYESSIFSTPELMRCVHSGETNASWGDTIEVEVRRAVLEEVGALCRYFQSGATQTLYPDGSVLTRYPVPNMDVNSLQVQVETLTTASGECYVRQLCEGEVSSFSHLKANKIESRMTFDRGNNCRILSREDRVTVVYYYHRNHNKFNSKKPSSSVEVSGISNSNNENQQDNLDYMDIQGENINDEIPFGVSSNIIARVTLHADGTCITSFSTGEEFFDPNNAPAPLRPLLEHVQVVEAACGAPVRYCVEAPSLPRIFVCASAADEINKENQENPSSISGVGVGVVAGGGAGNNNNKGEAGGETMVTGVSDVVSEISASMPPSHHNTTNANANTAKTNTNTNANTGKVHPHIDHPVILSPLSDTPTSVFAAAVREELMPQRKTVYDRFYIVFGDGSVLRRRVTYHGTRGPPIPFLETLFTRPTESSIRIIHESGLAIVEPAEAARRNSQSPASLAIGEGFAMFDLTLGGMRLVDYQHHITEVRDLFSSGSIYAHIKPSSLEELLRQLVLPTYTPHAVPKARKEAMKAEELATESQSRKDRASGICPPLMNRLRELAESFIIAHELLRVDILNSAKRQWEMNRTTGNKRKITLSNSVNACWGGLSSLMGTSEGASLQRAFASLNMPSLDTAAAALPPMGITPLFFSELENGVVVQYLHERDVEEYMRSKDAEPFPVFLSHSTASGEPGVQQLTFFRVEAANGTISNPSMADFSRQYRGSKSPSSAFLHTNYSRTGESKNTVVSGSLLGIAVQKQNQLAFFPGKPTPFPTTRWLPPTMQPPRRFLEPNLTTQRDGNTGGLVVVGNITQEESNGGLSPSSYERLRVFLKFTEATRVAQQVVLLGETMRYKQLASLVTYQKAMHDSSSKTLHEAEEEQQRLREKYFAVST
ncbi:uncharacterized protein TM35_000421390 [Trypanosoma theileri]|uniref:Uncharacterized protein n=1 Tax=Trypanosoma theileri TaxID=67003 RepID=A0A1X0NJB8_9TRYP|nr:uncharacterized protein TM35_000421390 [Trypanosoma theileri]ORC84681.1 hypothetical protein TM35_000421390 [Trypanosoma theileri]